MKKLLLNLLFPFITLSMSGCAFFEFNDNAKNFVELADGENPVKWTLLENKNEFHPCQTAYFEVSKTTIKYFEDGKLIKEGTPRAVYHGQEKTRPLTIVLNFGKDQTGLEQYDELYCFTEDDKESIHQFSIMSEGYHIKPLRTTGGVPIRDYHLSEMPYAFGTYVKEKTEYVPFKNSDSGKVGNSVNLNGTFIDSNNNKFYFLNNRYFNNEGYYFSSSATYFTYENSAKNISLEGTIYLSYFDSYEYGRRVNTAMLHVMHGESEPSKEKGVYMPADYHLLDFDFADKNTFSFAKADYFSEEKECSWDPNDFVTGTYSKIN